MFFRVVAGLSGLLLSFRKTGKQMPNRKWGWTVSAPPFLNDAYFSKVLPPAQTAPLARESIQTREPMGWVTVNYFSCGCDTILSGNLLIIAGGEEAFLLTHGLQAQSIMIYDIWHGSMVAEAIQGYGSRSVGAACSYLSRPGSDGDKC